MVNLGFVRKQGGKETNESGSHRERHKKEFRKKLSRKWESEGSTEDKAISGLKNV